MGEKILPKLQMQFISSLEKVFLDEPFSAPEITSASMLKNEAFHFQLACCSDTRINYVNISLKSPIEQYLTLRKVEWVPAKYPIPKDNCDDYILHNGNPGLYPDVLEKINPVGDCFNIDQWVIYWISVQAAEDLPVGTYPVTAVLSSEGEILAEKTFQLHILPAKLSEKELICTNWFYCDCIANWYGIEVFGEEHWRRVEQFMSAAASHGINLILTPLFTPPLDTAIGTERPTVQLVGVKKQGESYTFDFSKLERWINMAHRCGIRYFELSHLFTQWGAKCAPKIMAEVDGRTQRIFGWETEATGEAYVGFLHQFLPALVKFINDHHLRDAVYFHLSDEPSVDHLENYRKIQQIVAQDIGDLPIMDAMSHTEFVEAGLTKLPVPSVTAVTKFKSYTLDKKFTYYCCGPTDRYYTNRFLCFPLARLRILGFQLYLEQIDGFLQWGFNFWNACLSKYAIDPYRVTDAGGIFSAGDGFIVYPSEEGPVASLRLEVFHQAMQDWRACKALEEKIGRDAVVALLQEGVTYPLTLTEYPHGAAWLLEKREAVNRKLAEESVK